MKYQNVAVGIFIAAQALILSACATNEGTGPTFTIPGSTYGPAGVSSQSDGSSSTRSDSHSSIHSDGAMSIRTEGASSIHSDGSLMKHNLRQLAEYDTYKMTKLVNREINLKDEDDQHYLNQVATTLGQTVFLQPHFTEREVALRELKGKIDQEDYVVVLEKAADDLLAILRTSSAPSDQAGATIALTNLVTEVKSLKRTELRGILQKIADARLKVSDEAKKYAMDPMQGLISPSQEAQSALKTL